MKTQNLVFLGAAAAVIAYLLLKSFGVITAPMDTLHNAAEVINSSLPSQPGWGWHYYSNGTAISPDGTYYHQYAPVAYNLAT